MRLIDADRFKSYIDCGHLRPPTEVCFSELDVCNMIDKQPTIETVQGVGRYEKAMQKLQEMPKYLNGIKIKQTDIVKCENCKYRDECEEVVLFEVTDDEVMGHRVYWCSYGRSEK